MRRVIVGAMLAGASASCGEGNPENSAACGFAAMAGATMVLEQMRAGTKVLDALPPAVSGVVPARVVGRGTQPALVGEGPEGPVVAFEGEGFPTLPGFGLVLVEDSAETFKGILIYDINPPRGLPRLGSVAHGTNTIPLYGTRVSWAAVSDPRCPLFAHVQPAEVP